MKFSSLLVNLICCCLVLVVGNMLTTPADSGILNRGCNNGSCVAPVVVPIEQAASDATGCDTCRKPMKKAAGKIVKAPIKAAAVAVKPVKIVGRAVKPLRFVGRVFGRRR
jgi:hypothetical protein